MNYENILGKERRNPTKEIIQEGEAKASKFLACLTVRSWCY